MIGPKSILVQLGSAKNIETTGREIMTGSWLTQGKKAQNLM